MHQHLYFAIIVTFNPDISCLQVTTKNLLKQGFEIIIIDNNSNNKYKIIESIQNCKFVLLKDNMGIAYALNKGMEEAKKLGGVWVLSLDQDTKISNQLLEEYKKNLNLELMGALCPRIIRKGEELLNPISNIEEVNTCPTAGFFTSIETWEKSGKYDDWMFIDYVDYDLCMKIKINGLKIYRINKTYVIQELGKTSINPIFYAIGQKLHIKKIKNFSRVYNHSPLRNYYFVRNALYYQNKYRKYLDMRYEISHMIRWQIKKLLIEPHKVENIKAIIRGIQDYKIKTQIR